MWEFEDCLEAVNFFYGCLDSQHIPSTFKCSGWITELSPSEASGLSREQASPFHAWQVDHTLPFPHIHSGTLELGEGSDFTLTALLS